LQAEDGWLALNLTRAEDWELLSAWLEYAVEPDWENVTRAMRAQPLQTLIARGRLLGLAVAPMAPPASAPWYSAHLHVANIRNESRNTAPLIVDLSSLWAGPLCGHLLQSLGARVIKVESLSRPDGARNGPAEFFDLLNAGKASVALDFTTVQGRAQLRRLLECADIVIEASRPRALRQLGLVAEEIIAANSKLTWISITGYGRHEPQENWVAFGDDAGVAAGLSHVLCETTGQPLFCGDAIADPLTGLHAALLAYASFRSGGGRLLALNLRDVVAHCAQFDLPPSTAELRARNAQWETLLRETQTEIASPQLRKPAGKARALGADTLSVLAELGISC
jgi:hypothetical protein